MSEVGRDEREPESIIPGYSQGYTRALLDVQEQIDEILWDLDMHHKRINKKYLVKFMRAMIDSRMLLRERRGKGFIRYNVQNDDFEYFDPDERWRLQAKKRTDCTPSAPYPHLDSASKEGL